MSVTAPTDKRELGISDLEITLASPGAWATGGGWPYGWEPQDEASSLASIRHAVEVGVNWIDTDAIFGPGRSQEVVGQAQKTPPRSDRPLVYGWTVPGRLGLEPQELLEIAGVVAATEAGSGPASPETSL